MMHRRDLLKAGAALSLAAALPGRASAQAAFTPSPGKWREFGLRTF